MIRPILRPSALLAFALAAAPALAQQAPRPNAPATQPAQQRAAQSRPAQQRPAPVPAQQPAAAPGGGQAVLLQSFGDWGAYATQAGRSKVCYAMSQPKDRQPATLRRGQGYLFVSFRPAEKVANEVAWVMGFPTRENGSAEAVIGTAKFDLLTKGENAWLRNPAEESRAIQAMNRGQNLVVRAVSARGNQTTDRYSLAGFGKALERAQDECRRP
ncbi:MAG TPA: invasion associated locus B family protein [Beijerinckiaceae bacterium]|nr:invasion associated locus B family protein [Beijerinckiaceae bacterium]